MSWATGWGVSEQGFARRGSLVCSVSDGLKFALGLDAAGSDCVDARTRSTCAFVALRLAGDHEVPARRRRCRGASWPSTEMRTHMLACKCIIAQILEAQANKKSFPVVMQVNYAGSRSRLPRTSTPFSDHAPAARRLWLGLVLARVCRDRPLGAHGRPAGWPGWLATHCRHVAPGDAKGTGRDGLFATMTAGTPAFGYDGKVANLRRSSN
jgi:hypothetical protein